MRIVENQRIENMEYGANLTKSACGVRGCLQCFVFRKSQHFHILCSGCGDQHVADEVVLCNRRDRVGVGARTWNKADTNCSSI